MFILSTLEDSIRVDPQDLGKPRVAAISSVIEATMLDKIVKDLGLVITLYDILSIESGFVHPSDGGVRFKVKFRLVVFRPFPGEVIVGKLKKASKEGLRVSVGFFDDILIPEHYLPDPSFFDESEGTWFWKYKAEDGEVNDMFMELEEEIRLKVNAIRFNPIPTPDELKRARESDSLVCTAEKPFAPMEVIGQINGDGLGPLGWWMQAQESSSSSSSSSSSGSDSGSGSSSSSSGSGDDDKDAGDNEKDDGDNDKDGGDNENEEVGDHEYANADVKEEEGGEDDGVKIEDEGGDDKMEEG